MSKPKLDVEEWAQAASELSSNEPPTTNMPMHVLFGEAVDVARFFERYWTTKVDEQGNVVLLGLESAVPKGQAAKPGAVALSAETGGEILSLQRACQEAQTCYLMAVGPRSGAGTIERGHALLGEITAALEWYFDDGVQDEKDAMLARVGAAHEGDPGTIDALASALDDYALLAQPHRDELDGLGGFQAAYIDEARAVAAELRERPAAGVPMPQATREAIALRNRLMTLLFDRMNRVRSAARFVFRGQPEIIREATSTYERRRRAAGRRAKEKNGTATQAKTA